jgi:hypothetical protein
VGATDSNQLLIFNRIGRLSQAGLSAFYINMRTFFYLLASLIFCFCGCSGCKDDCSSGSLQFDLPVQAYGIKDTLYQGDTIRIKLDIHDKLPERNSGIVYDFVDYNFKLIAYMVKIDSFPATAHSQVTFDWITLQGESQYVGDVFLVLPTFSDNAYNYEVLIIPKQKGLYVFGMNSDFSRASPLKELEGPCSKNSVEPTMKLKDDTNVNFEFLKQSPDPSQANIDRKRFDEFAGFCFYVR